MRYNRTKIFGLLDNMTPAQKKMFWQRVKIAGIMGLVGGGGMLGIRNLSQWWKNRQAQQNNNNNPNTNNPTSNTSTDNSKTANTNNSTGTSNANNPTNTQQSTNNEPDMSNWTQEQIQQYNSTHYNYDPNMDFTKGAHFDTDTNSFYSNRWDKAITKSFGYYEPTYHNNYPSYILRNYPSFTPRGTYINDEYIDENLQNVKPSFNTKEDAKDEFKKSVLLTGAGLGAAGYGGYKAFKHFLDDDNND